MIQAFFFDLQAINAGKLRPAGHRAVPGHQGRRARRRDDGRRHRLLLRPRRHAGRAQGRRARERREGQGLLREAATPRRSRAASCTEEKKARSCSTGSPPTADPADLAGCDLVIEAVFEDPSLKHQVFAEVAPYVERRRAAVLEHLDPADHRARHGVDRPADFIGLHFFIARRQDAAGRDHQGQGDLRRRAGQGVRRRAADPEDADRRQRQPRLLHLAGHRHDGQRGPGDARRGRAPGLASSGRRRRRLPGRPAPAQRRAEHGADGKISQGHHGRRRARRPPTSRTRGARSSTR